MQDDTALREQLLEAQMRLELGEISAKEFASVERSILTSIRKIKGRRRRAIAMSPKASAVEIETWK